MREEGREGVCEFVNDVGRRTLVTNCTWLLDQIFCSRINPIPCVPSAFPHQLITTNSAACPLLVRIKYCVSILFHVSRCGLAVRRQAGTQKDLGSILFGSPFLFKNCGLWTLSCGFAHTISETLKRLT